MTTSSKAVRKERKLRRIVVIIIVLLLGGALPAARYGPRLYSRWEQHHLVSQAGTLMRQGEYRKAALGLRRALELNPNHLEASRLFARLAEEIGKSEAVSLRERVCVLAPDSFDDAYAWASAALRFGDTARARQALEIMKRTGPDRGGSHAILGRLAQVAGRLPEARAELGRALQIAPEDQNLQYEVAVIDLEMGTPGKGDEAIETLNRLRKIDSWHVQATRTLAASYARMGKMDEALPIAKELSLGAASTIQDRLFYLTMLKASGNPHFIAYLTDMQNAVKENPGEATLFINWANSHSMGLLSHEWLGTLPPAMLATPPLAISAADTCLLAHDWKGLQKLTATPGWTESEHLRMAYLSRALLEQGDQTNSDLQWKAAIALVAKRSERLYELTRLAAAWGWGSRQEALLWFIAENTKQGQSALQSLAAHYSQTRDSRNLLRTLSAMLVNTPGDVALQNNWVMLSLLLRTDLERAAEVARQLYTEKPADPHAAATYAFALYSSNRTDDALEVMRKLTAPQLLEPATAAYYGLLLAAVRDPQAPKYLALAKSARLLPEEEQMLKKAQLALNGQ